MLRHGWTAEYAIGFAVSVTVAFSILFGWIARGLAWLYFLMMSLAVGQLGHSLADELGKDDPRLRRDPRCARADVVRSGSVRSSSILLLHTDLRVPLLSRIEAIYAIAFRDRLQGVRDNPVRMASLGFNVRLAEAPRHCPFRPSLPRCPGSSTSSITNRRPRGCWS